MLELPNRRYGAIYADPPWSFKTWSDSGLTERSAEHHYGTLGCDHLAEIPVNQVAADDCALFMWVVDSHLDVAMDLIRAWGFTYKTRAFVWVKTCKSDPTKPRMGLGYWTRKETELCLLATRGKPKRMDAGVRQVIMEPRREHSRKPDGFYERIERLVDGPYLEMFARQLRPGWDSWGNQVDKFSIAAKAA